MKLPVDIIKEHYKYLDEYGFSIYQERYSPEFFGDAEVIYQSSSVVVKIVVDRSQVLINIGKGAWPEKDWFEFSDVMRFFAPGERAYVFAQSSVENQVKRTARLMKQYCWKLLEGDFSMQDQIKTIEAKRVAAMLSSFQKLSPKNR